MFELLERQETAQLKGAISAANNIVICAHKSPDGDAIGSTLAWKHFLQQQGKQNVKVCYPDATPDFLQWLPGFKETLRYDRQTIQVKQAFNNADLVFYLDFGQSSRTEDMQTVLDTCQAPIILIDHHLQPKGNYLLQASFTQLSSTSEIIFNLIYQLGGYDNMTKACAECIYCGMMTDTGGFTYNSTRPEIFSIISLLLQKGIDKDNIYNKVFHNYSEHALRLRSHIILNKMNYIENLHTSYFMITKSDLQKFHFIKGDLEGLVNTPQLIKGLKLSISLREDTEKPNLILVSLRSSNGFHCQPMATKFFNGGGHADAAGGKLHCSMEEAEQVTIKALLAYRGELEKN